ncbi:MAG: anaerobic C4-dicarboxylate transporter, partial [Deferribacteraceae bacterium]|jgi:anaerobic C4-dicarboxylate transporter DcuB|nr:anaerobic C4-dicarboxylate transporter [Deferribacteraceae bacterium]
MYEYMYGSTATTLDKQLPFSAKLSVYIFLFALATIVFFATFQQFLPAWGTPAKKLDMSLLIQIIMLATSGLILIICKAKPKDVMGGSVWQAGMVAVVAIYGIAWLSDTFFLSHKAEMMAALKGIVEAYPWSIAIVFFAVSVLINTQGGVVLAILPLAYDLGIPWPVLLGVLPSVYAYFFIPNYPSDIATVNFDRSGTTVIGKYLLNHSFMVPGLICVISSTIIGYIVTSIIY